MKKTLVLFGILATMLFGVQTFAACPCAQPSCPCQAACPAPCPVAAPCCPTCNNSPCTCPSSCCNKCSCEDWICRMEELFCKIGLNECQKEQARRAIAQFQCDTKCLNLCSTGCGCTCGSGCNCGCGNKCCCESKCDCRQYKRELKNLDCEMKKIITKCQKSDYKCVKSEVKDQVKCCHKCLIWPFSLCKCCCDNGCNCGCGCSKCCK